MQVMALPALYGPRQYLREIALAEARKLRGVGPEHVKYRTAFIANLAQFDETHSIDQRSL
jgi:hypothetical protein